MKITYYGHSAFLLESADGTRVIVDPYRHGAYGGALRYGAIQDSAQAVVASHAHDDHGATDTISGNPQVFVHPTSAQVGPWRISGVDVYHDDELGKSRGRNSVLIFDDGDVRVVHLGDLGHIPSDPEVKQVGTVDVLFLPVGGVYTIDASQATQTAQKLNPRIIIPMHYKTPHCGFPLAPVEDFTAGKTGVKVVKGSEVEIRKEKIPPSPEIVVLQPAL